MLPSRDKFPCRDIFLDLQSFHLKGFLNGPTFHIFFFQDFELRQGKHLVLKLSVRFESTKHKRGVNCVFSIFQNSRKQPVNLFGQAVLDTARSKNSAELRTHDFYVENLEPKQGKKPRPTTYRISTQSTKRA